MRGPLALSKQESISACLDWQGAMGVDSAFGNWSPGADMQAVQPVAQRSEPVAAVEDLTPVPIRVASSGRASARSCAEACHSLDDLQQALRSFEGCKLKKTANKLCFGEGNPAAEVMLIGEAPGAEEDRQGRPFVGASGRLLDHMLSSIGLLRESVWITNLIFWRPPGNRTPTADEIAACQPFLERQVELISPNVILFVGGTAAKAMLGVKQGVMKLRGQRSNWTSLQGKSFKTLVTFHPAFLLRQPLQKKFAWRDFLTLSEMLATASPESSPAS